MRAICLMLGMWLVVTATFGAHGQSDTVFTYQGSLSYNGQPADGMYNMDFLLWDADSAGQQIGPTVMIDDIIVSDGNFTVELDFGADVWKSVRWLEIEVNGITLTPRQQVTASPFAITTRGFHMGENGRIGIGTTDPQDDIHIEGVSSNFPRLRLGNSSLSWSGFNEFDTRTLSIEKHTNKHSTIELNPMSSSQNHNRYIEFFRRSITNDQPEVRFMRGKGQAEISAKIASDGGDSYFQAHGGYLGIGTTTPQHPLEVVGNGVFHNRVGIGNPAFLLGQLSVAHVDGGAPMAISAGSNNDTLPTLLATNSGGGPTIWAQGGSDSSLAGGGHVVIGDEVSTNISIDDNELMARNNGGTSDLHLNADGGNVRMGEYGILPAFAYGKIDAQGNAISLSPNITSTQRVAEGAYDITIAGGFQDSDVVVATAYNVITVGPNTNVVHYVVGNVLHIQTWFVYDNERQDKGFSFIVYRP